MTACTCGHAYPPVVPVPSTQCLDAAPTWQDDPTRLGDLFTRRPDLAGLAVVGARLAAGVREGA